MKEWTTVQPRKKKRSTSTPQRVWFSQKLVHDSPPVKHRPQPSQDFIRIGDLIVPTAIPVQRVFGCLNSALNVDPVSAECSSPVSNVQNSNFAPAKVAPSVQSVWAQVIRPVDVLRHGGVGPVTNWATRPVGAAL